MKIIFCWLSFFCLLLLCPIGCQKKQENTSSVIEVDAFQIEAQTIPADFEFVGVCKSSHPVQIRARVEGYLMSIDYLEGSVVEEGQLLFRIDPQPFEAKLAEAEGALARQEAVLWRAKRELERIEPLYKENAASRRDLDNSIAQVLTAEASVISAKANVYDAKLNLGYTRLTSPIHGLAGKAQYREGSLIKSTANVALSENEFLQGRASKSDEQLILPEEGEYTVELTLADGTKFPYKGKVSFASPTFDQLTGTLSIRAVFPNPEEQLLPGQFVQARVSGSYRPNAIFVPQTAVAQGQKGMYVFVIDKNNTASMQQVEVGPWYQNYWVIKKGLMPGEIVVSEGTNKLNPGSKVSIHTLSSPQGNVSKDRP
jgi:membrane fusion protein (multidrug efflux system)